MMLICFGYVTPVECQRVRLLVDVGLFRTRPAKATVDALLKARTATTAKVSVARDSVVYVQGSTAGQISSQPLMSCAAHFTLWPQKRHSVISASSALEEDDQELITTLSKRFVLLQLQHSRLWSLALTRTHACEPVCLIADYMTLSNSYRRPAQRHVTVNNRQ